MYKIKSSNRYPVLYDRDITSGSYTFELRHEECSCFMLILPKYLDVIPMRHTGSAHTQRLEGIVFGKYSLLSWHKFDEEIDTFLMSVLLYEVAVSS